GRRGPARTVASGLRRRDGAVDAAAPRGHRVRRDRHRVLLEAAPAHGAGHRATAGGIMILAFSVAPSGVGASGQAPEADGSVSAAVAAAIRVVRASGLPYRTSSMFTEIEGEWDE